MAKASREMVERIAKVDLVIEVRDARVPLTSAAAHLERLLRSSGRTHRRLLVLNKTDLISRAQREATLAALGIDDAYFVSARTGRGVEDVLEAAVRRLQELSPRLFRPDHHVPRPPPQSPGFGVVRRAPVPSGLPLIILVAGAPNTGKSSLINAMRRHAGERRSGPAARPRGNKVARTGAMPGVTRQLSGFQVSWGSPPVWMLDTPGVLPPMLDGGWIAALRLGALDILQHERAGAEGLGGFLLHYLAATRPYALRQWPSAHALLKAAEPAGCTHAPDTSPASVASPAARAAAGIPVEGRPVDGRGLSEEEQGVARSASERLDAWRAEAVRLLHAEAITRKQAATMSARRRGAVVPVQKKRVRGTAEAEPASAAASAPENAMRAHEMFAAQLLHAVARDMGASRGVQLDLNAASGRLLKLLREGKLGNIFLELNDKADSHHFYHH